MRVNIKRVGDGPMTIEAFADRHDLTMDVQERRGISGHQRFWAAFHRVEIGENGVLTGAYGNGATPEEAIAQYAKRIQGEHLVQNAYSPDRTEFDAPNEFLP